MFKTLEIYVFNLEVFTFSVTKILIMLISDTASHPIYAIELVAHCHTFLNYKYCILNFDPYLAVSITQIVT